ncbi:MAG: hypothetical protein U0W24_16520 [Bacteroidales bacterium]
MNTFRAIIILLVSINSFQNIFAQSGQKFLDSYNFYKNQGNELNAKYFDTKGSPYLNDDFQDGIVFLKDTSYSKFPLRYNIYEDDFEYKYEGKIYVIGNPGIIDRIEIGDITFMHLPFIQSKGFFEVIVSGASSLVQQYNVRLNPAKAPQPYVEAAPAEFIKEKEAFYIVNSSGYFEIKNISNVTIALSDKKELIEKFLKDEKIKKIKRENLVKIVKYYNDN